MNDFDREFAERLQKSEFTLPDSYEKRFQETMDQITAMNAKRYFLLFHSKLAAVITICLLSLSASVGVGAAINAYQHRMGSVGSGEVMKYQRQLQGSDREADRFDRQLTEDEVERMAVLREKYRSEGLFPSREIDWVRSGEQAGDGQLHFCEETSTFHIPDRALSDEELLQIIDLIEKRDYSVRQENVPEEQKSVGAKMEEEEAVEFAKQVIADIYQVGTGDVPAGSVSLDTTQNSEGEQLSSYLVELGSGKWAFDALVEIDAVSGKVNGIDIADRKREECVPGIEVRREDYIEYSEEIGRILGVIVPEGAMVKMWMDYRYLDDGTLNRGNVRYTVETEDGDGYVFLYSVNTGRVYDIYRLPDGVEAENTKGNGDGGIHTEKKILYSK